MKQTNERLCALAQKGDAAALDSLIDNNKSFIGKVANDLFRSIDVYKRQQKRSTVYGSSGSAFTTTAWAPSRFQAHFLCRHPMCR